jgi:glycosyltransferase involved in cell wall biosynthesis
MTDIAHPAAAPAIQAPARTLPGRPVPAVSIVVPTRNEAGNIAALLAALDAAVPLDEAEVIFVDDSSDETPDVVRAQSRRYDGRRIELIHRQGEERTGGLGGAVVAGMRRARGDWVCVMDADLQHPPQLVPHMLGRAAAGDVDLVIASRFCGDGSTEDFGPLRRLLSRGSTMLAERLFASRLRDVTDPMSGFFLVRRSAVDVDALRPDGFKILLEILVRGRPLRTTEVPFAFGVRHSGDSKASATEGARYLRQLWRLRFHDLSARFGRFGLVGLSGLLVNTLLLALFTDALGLWYVAGAILATQGSSLWNFALTDRWVFRGGEYRRSTAARLAAFLAMNNVALVLRIPLLFALVSGLGIHHLAANLLTLVALTVARFGLADSWIWSRAGGQAEFAYDIHGLLTIASEAPLPELERFRVDGTLADPTIRVRIGRVRSRGVGATELDETRTAVHYVEALGNLGFGAELELGERVDIRATPLLRHSPHVLYTNVVEPVLRWTFVERGYALVHAACMARDEDGLLITARTDTGKTTTALKTLDSLPYGFLSDDLTLVAPDGRVLTYPKPLTISRHTLSAVRSPLLTRKERLGLIVQSRLHSKSGRLFGLIIAKTRMPAATINALVQMVVPPPKYHVDRLVPGVQVQPEAQIRAMAVIQREGDEGAEALRSDEALEILLSNCEDAYGFPPYPTIQHWLHSRNGKDLKAVERGIIVRALTGTPAQLLRSHDRNWYRMLPGVVAGVVGEVAGGAVGAEGHERVEPAPAGP